MIAITFTEEDQDWYYCESNNNNFFFIHYYVIVKICQTFYVNILNFSLNYMNKNFV